MKRITTTLLCVMIGAAAAPAGSPAQQPPIDEYTELAPAQPRPLAAESADSGRATPEVQISGRGPRRFELGFADPAFRAAETQEALFDETVAVNASVVQVWMDWSDVAPTSPSPGFDATDPGSPEYSFDRYDAVVRETVARGMRPTILIRHAPAWAEGPNRPSNAAPGTWKPDPGELAAFATAVARRYSGSFAGLPAVRHYVAWNEPNLETELSPVWKGKSGKKPAAPDHYVKMLNSFYGAVKGVSTKNRVVAGGTAPYGADPGVLNMRPLQFWRELLCVKGNGSKKLRKKKTCTKPKFDILTHHPINTSGGPRRSAIHPDDVSTPDLKHVVEVLRFAERKNNVKPGKGKREVWANEIWWESDPPDPAPGNPSLRKQARWYNESFYLLWKQGASLVLPFQVRDEPFFGGPGRASYQTGVYFVDGKPKPAAKAVSFPFVGDRKRKRKILLWGIAPESGRVKVEERRPRGFKRVKRFRVREGKLFTKKVRLKGKVKLRARIKGERSMVWKVAKR